MSRKKKNVNDNRWIGIYFFVSLIVYITIYFFFIIDGGFKPGAGLNKGNWLDFLGVFGSTLATLFFSIVVLKQNKKLNELSEQSMKLSVLEKIPIMNVTLTDIYMEFITLEKEVQDMLIRKQGSAISPSQPIIQLENKQYEYFVYVNNKFKLNHGYPLKDAFFSEIARQENGRDMIRKLTISNVTNNPAFDIILFCDEHQISYKFNLASKESKSFIIAMSQFVDISFKIKFFLLTGTDKYEQTFSYNIKTNNGFWFGDNITLPKSSD